jgi:hypothetical protein
MTTNADDLAQRPEFTLDEAIAIVERNADAYEKVPSVSRTLLAEIERLREEVEKYKAAWTEYNDRTEWVQQTAKPEELGMHRADVLRMRIETAERKLAELQASIAKAPRAKVAKVAAGIASLIAPKELEGKYVHLLAVEQHLPEGE